MGGWLGQVMESGRGRRRRRERNEEGRDSRRERVERSDGEERLGRARKPSTGE